MATIFSSTQGFSKAKIRVKSSIAILYLFQVFTICKGFYFPFTYVLSLCSSIMTSVIICILEMRKLRLQKVNFFQLRQLVGSILGHVFFLCNSKFLFLSVLPYLPSPCNCKSYSMMMQAFINSFRKYEILMSTYYCSRNSGNKEENLHFRWERGRKQNK